MEGKESYKEKLIKYNENKKQQEKETIEREIGVLDKIIKNSKLDNDKDENER